MTSYEHIINLNHLQELNTDSLKTIINESKMHRNQMLVLQLNNISTLSPSIFKSFSEFTINTTIELKSLNELDLKTAIGLSRFKGLLILGNPSFDPDALKILMVQRGAMELCGLENLSVGLSAILKQYQGNVLDLSALQSLHQEDAAELAQYKGEFLSLNGLKLLSPNTAAALSHYHGHLFLDGIAWLPPETLKNLCKHAGKMNLDGLLLIGTEEAKLLAAKSGNHLSLRGISSIADEALEQFFIKKRTVVFCSQIRMSDWAKKNSLSEGLVEFSLPLG